MWLAFAGVAWYFDAALRPLAAGYLSLLPFVGIVEVVSRVLDRHAGKAQPIRSVEDALQWDAWARNEAGTTRAVEPRASA